MAIRKIELKVGKTPTGRVAYTWSYPEDDGKIYEVPIYNLTVSGEDNAGNPHSKTFDAIRFGVLRTHTYQKARVVGLGYERQHVLTIKRWIPTYRVHSAPSSEDGAWQVYKHFLIHDGPDDPTKAPYYATIGCVEMCGPSGFIKFNDFIVRLSGAAAGTKRAKLKQIGLSKKMIITYLKATKPALKEVMPP